MNDNFQGTGRRKRSIARVTLSLGQGVITINKKPIDEYFPRQTLQQIVRQPLEATQSRIALRYHRESRKAAVKTGQAGAVRHGIARALLVDGRIAARSAAQTRLADPRPARKRIEEVRPQARPQTLPVLEALIVAASQEPQKSRLTRLFSSLTSFTLPFDIALSRSESWRHSGIRRRTGSRTRSPTATIRAGSTFGRPLRRRFRSRSAMPWCLQALPCCSRRSRSRVRCGGC